MDIHDIPLRGVYFIGHVRDCGDDIHPEFTEEPLLHYLHMEQPKEAASEPEPERKGRFRLEYKRSIIQLEFLKRGPELLILVSLHRIHSCKQHRLDLLKSCNRLLARILHMRYGISDLHLGRSLDARYDIAYTSARYLVPRAKLHFEDPYLVGLIFSSRIEELDLVSCLYGPVLYLEICDDSSEGIEYGVKNKRLKRSLRIS